MGPRSKSLPRGTAPALAITIVFSSGEAVGSKGGGRVSGQEPRPILQGHAGGVGLRIRRG